ncbi:Major exported protein [compost metagenome]
MHKPFIFTSALNKATPLLYHALASGEMLPEVEVKWYRTSIDGKQEHFFTTALEDATIVDITSVLPHAQDPSKSDFTQLIKVAMAYRKITWTHEIAGTEASDDWRKPLES